MHFESLKGARQVRPLSNSLPLVMLEHTDFEFMLVESMVKVEVAVHEGLYEDLHEGPPLLDGEDAILLDVGERVHLEHLLVGEVEVSEGQEEVLLAHDVLVVEELVQVDLARGHDFEHILGVALREDGAGILVAGALLVLHRVVAVDGGSCGTLQAGLGKVWVRVSGLFGFLRHEAHTIVRHRG